MLSGTLKYEGRLIYDFIGALGLYNYVNNISVLIKLIFIKRTFRPTP